MCGIIAIARPRGCGPDTLTEALTRGSRAIAHRGPDGEGLFEGGGEAIEVGLGHRRLAILDLSEAGLQPFSSPCGRWRLSFNGEIYNYRELARQLRDIPEVQPILDMSSGDTAVFLAAIAAWGVERALSACLGMWAFALWDEKRESLTLSRDRFGIKPLYYLRYRDGLYVASEIKAVLEAARPRLAVDAEVASAFILTGHALDQERTFFRGVTSLPPGSCCEIDLSGGAVPRDLVIQRYWRHPYETGESVDDGEASPEMLRDLFLDAVRIHLRADVPVGLTLSGGLDSSAILYAAAQVEPDADLYALSVVSDDPRTNEKPFIDMALSGARHGQTRTINLDHRFDDLVDGLDHLTWINDQPLKSTASLGLSALCATARRDGVKVILTGQGADEQLGGYGKFLFFRAQDLVRRGDMIGAATLMTGFLAAGQAQAEFRLSEAKRYLPGLLKRTSGALLHSSARIAPSGPGVKGYRAREHHDVTRASIPLLLHDEDRMSMASSVEMRVPFLDHRLVEFLARVDPAHKLKAGWTKAIFRDAMSGLVPEAIVRRRDKKGFSVPERLLVTGRLGAMASDLLSGHLLADRAGLLNGPAVRNAFESLRRGERSLWSSRELFRCVALEVWLRRFEPWLSL